MSVTMKELLEAGSHFGHQTRRWNPRMAKYIYGARNGIHIIDLQKTLKKFREAYAFTKDLSARGGKFLFVGTKKQAQELVTEEAIRCGMFYVNKRWLGGTLTNFVTIKKSINRLKRIEEMQVDGTFDRILKKEATRLTKELEKLKKFLLGIKDMNSIPGAVFIVDPRKEKIALAESRKLGIPVIGIVDSNCDPDLVDYIIPANDDAIRSIRLFCSKIANAVLEGKEIAEAASKERDRQQAEAAAIKAKEKTRAKGAESKEKKDVKRFEKRPRTRKKEAAPKKFGEGKVKKEIKPARKIVPKASGAKAKGDK